MLVAALLWAPTGFMQPHIQARYVYYTQLLLLQADAQSAAPLRSLLQLKPTGQQVAFATCVSLCPHHAYDAMAFGLMT
jgi:BarA-like signal transduction histidine kinase